MPTIVTVNVTQDIAPTPSTLQQTGAFLTQGGTNTNSGTLSLLTQFSDLTPLLAAAKTLTSLSWTGGVVTATASAAHGVTTGDSFVTTIAGASPAGYNGTFLATATTATEFTYPLTVNPGTETAPGTYTPPAVGELVAMATTFFAQGASTSVYVLELGAGTVSQGVSTLSTWISASPQKVYSYLVPREWDADADYLALLADFEATTAKTYFFTTTTTVTYSDYTALMKDVVALIEAPTISVTEFSMAAPFWVSLHYNPSTTNKVAPFAFSYVFGVTPYPTVGNAALLATLKAAGVNVIGTGAEGGISNAILLWGTNMDLRPFNYWFSVDWLQINGAQAIANEVINGSNNPINPLYYNQDGINRLESVLAQKVSSGVTFGLVLGTVVQLELDSAPLIQALDSGQFAAQAVVNAVPFVPYATANPGDYKIGKYAGLSVIYTPARGFDQIVLNINVSDFVVQ